MQWLQKARGPNYEFDFSAGPQWAPSSAEVTLEVAIPKWSRSFWRPAVYNTALPLRKACDSPKHCQHATQHPQPNPKENLRHLLKKQTDFARPSPFLFIVKTGAPIFTIPLTVLCCCQAAELGLVIKQAVSLDLDM